MRKLHETERAPPKCRTFALDFLFRTLCSNDYFLYRFAQNDFRNHAVFDVLFLQQKLAYVGKKQYFCTRKS